MARRSRVVLPVGGPQSLRAALRERGWEAAPGVEVKAYWPLVHRGNSEAARVLGDLGLTDPGDRRYFRLPAGADHQVSRPVFDAVAGRSSSPLSPGGYLVEYGDL